MLRQHLTREVLIGVEDIAKALNNQFVNIPGSYLDAFLRVMHQTLPPANPISFVFYNRGTQYCFANEPGNPANIVSPASTLLNNLQSGLGTTPHESVVECNILLNVDYSRYTTVHELGHVFTVRAGGATASSTSFYGLLALPQQTGEPQGIINDSSDLIVLGKVGVYFNPTTGLQEDEWARGRRGWGSSGVYRMSSSGSGLEPACYFQQNPRTDSGKTQAEILEAAADMFLNWVYEELQIMGIGFENVDWASATTCLLVAATTNMDPSLPGTARYNYMEIDVMPRLSSTYGW
jgi:hypothetical protein